MSGILTRLFLLLNPQIVKFWLLKLQPLCLILVSACLMANFNQVVFSNEPSFDPWLSYRSLGLDDLKLALIQTDHRLERLRTEMQRTEKLVRAGASPRMELVEIAGELQIRVAERSELVALINWLAYLQNLSRKDFTFNETQYFEMLTGLLKPRVIQAQASLDLARQRHETHQKLKARNAIPQEEFEISSDDLTEKKSRLLFYRAQYLSAQYALEVRKAIREYQDVESSTLAQAVNVARNHMWESILQSIDHRLARLKTLNQRGIVSQSEIDSVAETRKTIEKTLESSKASQPEPYPAPGRLNRPQTQTL